MLSKWRFVNLKISALHLQVPNIARAITYDSRLDTNLIKSPLQDGVIMSIKQQFLF